MKYFIASRYVRLAQTHSYMYVGAFIYNIYLFIHYHVYILTVTVKYVYATAIKFADCSKKQNIYIIFNIGLLEASHKY